MVEMAKLFLIYLVALAAVTFVRAHQNPQPLSSSRSKVKTMWIEQKLDHFNKSDIRTWMMRYMVNDEFYVSGGPVVIYVGGIWPISAKTLTKGHVYDTAKEHNAILLYTEHRFYGESRPVQNLTNENLKYLDVQQALADLAHFIRKVKSSSAIMKNSKIILVGNSYSGSMVIWFKKLYPDLAVGGWASSAPLLAKLDFKEEKVAIGRSIRLLGGDACYNRIANSINEMEQMLKTNKFAELKLALNLCNTFNGNNELDVASMFSQVSQVIALLVRDHKNHTIQLMCSIMMEDSDDFEGFTNFLVNFFGNDSCIDLTYNHQVAAFKNIQFQDDSEQRQFYYQMCNEFGWYPTTTSTQQPFGSMDLLSFFIFMCQDVFSDKFTLEYMERQVNKTNQLFGGLNPQVENIYMTYGQLDFWREVGIQDKDKATIIPMISHASDLNSISDKDSKELKAAKMKFKELVKVWLKD